MYADYFGLTKKPFSLVPDPNFLYLSEKHKKAISILRYGLVNQAGFTVITGEVGSGKTTIIRSILDEYKELCEVGLITHTHNAFGDLLTWVLSAFKIESNAANKAERYEQFVDFVNQKLQAKKRVLLIVDEAQNMDIQTLEELRLLSNINVDQDFSLQLVLVGQPELLDKLNQPELRQFSQRISIEYHLKPLNFEETEHYIKYRLKRAGGKQAIFQQSAIAALYYYSNGIPRLINNIADLALVFAFGLDKKQINWKIIMDVIKERNTGGIKRFEGKIVAENMVERAKEGEKLRRKLLDLTGVDIAKTL